MKGKIFKRLASAMLGLMVAFAAIGVNTAFAGGDVNIDDTKLELNAYNFIDTGIAKDDRVSFSLAMTIKPKNAADNGKTVSVDGVKLCFTEKSNLFTADGTFVPTFLSSGDLGRCVAQCNTNATGYKSEALLIFCDENGTPVSRVLTIGKTYYLGDYWTKWYAQVNDKEKVEISFPSDLNVIQMGSDDSDEMDNDAEFTFYACDHSDKPIYTPIDENRHRKVCSRPGCNFAVEDSHNFSGAQVIAATDDTLGSQYTICSDCFYINHTKVNRKAGTTPKYMSDGKGGKMNISAYSGLNKASVKGVIVQDPLGELGGQKMVLKATEATADSPVRKNIASKISADDMVCTFTIEVNDKIVKSDDIKDSLRILYPVPAGMAPSVFAQFLEDIGVTGEFDPQSEKINDIEYIAVWSKTVGPYVLPNGAAAAAGTNGANKTTTTSTSGKSAKTGDAAGMVCLAASGLLVVAGLYMELMKKKKNA